MFKIKSKTLAPLFFHTHNSAVIALHSISIFLGITLVSSVLRLSTVNLNMEARYKHIAYLKLVSFVLMKLRTIWYTATSNTFVVR